MKHILQISILFLLMNSQQANSFAQSPIRSIESCLNSKDLSSLVEHLHESADISILSSEDTYKPREAANKIAFFFRIHKAYHFEVRHKGSSPNSSFVVGDLHTKDGTYEIYFVLKRGKIVELTIDQ